MNYIVIPHTLPVRRWKIESLADAAENDGLGIDRFNTLGELIASFGECEADIPESYLKAVEHTGFPCVHVYDDAGNINYWESVENFYSEQAALDFFQMSFNSIIKVETIEDAKFYAEKYTGHQWPKVRSIASEILEEMEEENE